MVSIYLFLSLEQKITRYKTTLLIHCGNDMALSSSLFFSLFFLFFPPKAVATKRKRKTPNVHSNCSSGITESGSVLATDDGDSSETAAVLPMEMDTDAPDLGGGDARPVFQTPVQAVGRGDGVQLVCVCVCVCVDFLNIF